ncbi:bifunctional 3'-5' exonuclease/DNA polymerase [Agromyces larvae]|uniref:DNA-directed DNA polymerase n=1 Tax=Agromyces larvae TaxID=2929802 RepID=A0ABY4C7I2_9MICO|nr:bifunctional 3'-5' exonuclease/DNA polymerase [Agromyces larvae]UOE46061.1 bifunctional 3'-5' exonuclease/DNA polymerase [Agromyces larvae]
MLADGEAAELPALVAGFERLRPRWVWSDTRRWAPQLLAAGVRVERCHDLRLCGAILEWSTDAEASRAEHPDRPLWLARGPAELAADATPGATPPSAGAAVPADRPALFELDELERHDDRDAAGGASDRFEGATPHQLAGEHDRQLAIVAGSARPARLRLLLAAESAGALIGAELSAAGVPWDAATHDRVLADALGPRPRPGAKPARMEELAARVRAELDAPTLNLDSQVDLLRGLRAAGIRVDSTARWELREHDHPAIAPLLAYKRLARLLSANGWSWLETWVVDGRFRPDYVPGGTATGRWATSGGGALQLPKQIRSAVIADPGWTLVVADAAQLEPRVLAAMAGDLRMAEAARGRDIYRGIVDAGVVAARDEAKVALLGAMYGATTGESGRLVPRLARGFPRAMALVDRAAAAGERGARVTTLLGRSSPLPPATWRATQARATEPEATAQDERRARSSARDWGRFTRNFVVQGTAAEWALCWMAGVRSRLAQLGDVGERADASPPATASGPVFARRPHLVYYLHDEIIVHTPAELADEVALAVRDSAAEAGRLLFGEFPVDFPLDLAIVPSYAEADG